MGLYDKNGYVDIGWILSRGYTFNAIVGGRGTGKTFTSLKYCLENHIPTMLMRRTQSQEELISNPDFSPVTPVAELLEETYTCARITKNISGIYKTVSNEDGEIVREVLPSIYTCALSTISNVRGFNGDRIELIIFDEFIPEPHERLIKEEGKAFLNAYETLNRNRELQGRPPIKVLLLANSNSPTNPIFLTLGLATRAERMQRKRGEIYEDKDRSIGLYMLYASPISSRKSETALYKLADDEFKSMALANDFEIETKRVKSKSVINLKPLAAVGNLCIYKDGNMTYYVSMHKSGNPPTYTTAEEDLKRFRKRFIWMGKAFLEDRFIYENAFCYELFKMYIGA